MTFAEEKGCGNCVFVVSSAAGGWDSTFNRYRSVPKSPNYVATKTQSIQQQLVGVVDLSNGLPEELDFLSGERRAQTAR
jgi:hypothetical protein